MKENDYNKIKSAVDQAKTNSAEITGQIKGKIQMLNEFEFNSNDPEKEADNYLNIQEPILDQLEKNIEKQKIEISEEYTKIIQKTAPGAEE